MDKNMEVPSVSHTLKIIDRKNLTLSGVKKIINFDNTEFNINSVMGNIVIKGENLEMVKLDTIEGNVVIKGIINSFIYNDNNMKENSILSKLFK